MQPGRLSGYSAQAGVEEVLGKAGCFSVIKLAVSVSEIRVEVSNCFALCRGHKFARSMVNRFVVSESRPASATRWRIYPKVTGLPGGWFDGGSFNENLSAGEVYGQGLGLIRCLE